MAGQKAMAGNDEEAAAGASSVSVQRGEGFGMVDRHDRGHQLQLQESGGDLGVV